MKRFLYLPIVTLFLFFLIPTVHAYCYVEVGGCTENAIDDPIMALSNIPSNGHGELVSVGNYTNMLCCGQTDLGGPHVLVNLSDASNAHVMTSTGGSDYSFGITVNKPVEYVIGGDCALQSDCVMKLSAVTNAHVANCSDTSGNYPVTVCSGDSVTGAVINMTCGNVTVDGGGTHLLDPACTYPTIPVPSKWCPGVDHCTYQADNSSTTNCYSLNQTIQNQLGNNISCSNGAWCPQGLTFNPINGECNLDLFLVCNLGYVPPAPEPPALICHDLINNKDECLSDTNPPVGPYPHTYACCNDIPNNVGFNWTNQTYNFSFYEELDVIVY